MFSFAVEQPAYSTPEEDGACSLDSVVLIKNKSHQTKYNTMVHKSLNGFKNVF